MAGKRDAGEGTFWKRNGRYYGKRRIGPREAVVTINASGGHGRAGPAAATDPPDAPVVEGLVVDLLVARADPMTASGHFSRPPTGSFVAVSGQFLVAAVTRGRSAVRRPWSRGAHLLGSGSVRHKALVNGGGGSRRGSVWKLLADIAERPTPHLAGLADLTTWRRGE